MRKKFLSGISFVLAAAMCFGVTACGNDTNKDKDKDNNINTPVAQVFTFTCNFNHPDSEDNKQNVTEGEKAIKPQDPDRLGYTFGGWFKEENCINEFSFDSAVTGDTTVYAKWTLNEYSVTLNKNITDEENTVIKVNHGAKVQVPEVPEREGFTFGGWFTDGECTEEYSFDTIVTKGFTLYAKWLNNAKTIYTVTFNANYGEEQTEVKQFEEGERVTPPANIHRAGYAVEGWYTDKECTQAYSLENNVTQNITLYAKWVPVGYTITFDLNYEGSEGFVTTVLFGEKAQKPADPVRKGYTFVRWNTDQKGLRVFNFNKEVTESVTLYASWVEVKNEYVFEAEDTYLDDIEGKGYSNDANGTDCIQKDFDGVAKASGGYFVGYLYKKGVEVPFTINSDRDVSDAKLVLRISCELVPEVTLSSTDFQIIVNGTPLSYQTVTMTNPILDISRKDKREFEDAIVIENVNLVEGENTIVLKVNNSMSFKGTAVATAWLVDCLKITTSAELTWTPTDNPKPN